MSANIGNANAVIFACCTLIHILPASCVYRTCAVNCKQPFVIETQSIVIFWCCHCGVFFVFFQAGVISISQSEFSEAL